MNGVKQNGTLYVANTITAAHDIGTFADILAPFGKFKGVTIELTSDDRLKYSEQAITDGIAVVRQLAPQSYVKTKSLDADPSTGKHEVGLIAQEVL